MINYFRSIIAGLLISIGTFVSPVKHITPTPPLKISISITPKATSTVILTPTTIVQSQVKQCQFNKEQMTALMKQYAYSDEDIRTFFEMRPGDCFNIKPNQSSVSQQTQNLENKVQSLEDCKKQMDQYTNCINQYNKDMEDYSNSLDPKSWRYGIYTPKPFNSCFKPTCSY